MIYCVDFNLSDHTTLSIPLTPAQVSTYKLWMGREPFSVRFHKKGAIPYLHFSTCTQEAVFFSYLLEIEEKHFPSSIYPAIGASGTLKKIKTIAHPILPPPIEPTTLVPKKNIRDVTSIFEISPEKTPLQKPLTRNSNLFPSLDLNAEPSKESSLG